MHRALRPAAARALGRRAVNPSGRRFASTSPVDRPRSWKSSFVRWGLAGGAVYYYSTSAAFAQEPSQLSEAPKHFSDSDLPTVDSVIEEKRQQIKTKLDEKNVVCEADEKTQNTAPEGQQQSVEDGAQAAAVEGSPEALEQEAGQQGAFNPETGEINWDCPCLGGMAHGPCGENFKAAFSCFVYSEAEPKGMDCIDKFQAMQDCFREHPDVYGDELRDDEASERQADETLAAAGHDASADAAQLPSANPETLNVHDDSTGEPDRQLLRDDVPPSAQLEKKGLNPKATDATAPETSPIPTKWDDATAANDEVKKEEMKTPADVQEEQKKGGKGQ